MITNFEDHTQPLSAQDLALSQAVLSVLGTKHLTAPKIAEDVNKLTPHKITPVKVRKIIASLRQTGNYSICSSSDGFWVSKDPDVLDRQVQSLNERIAAIIATRDGMAVNVSKVKAGA